MRNVQLWINALLALLVVILLTISVRSILTEQQADKQRQEVSNDRNH